MYIYFFFFFTRGMIYMYISRIHARSKKNKWYVYTLVQEECVDLILQAKSYSMFSLAEIRIRDRAEISNIENL